MVVAQIKQLSAHTVEKLRSDVIVSSLSQALEEVVCNSIDAGATEVKVSFAPSGRISPAWLKNSVQNS